MIPRLFTSIRFSFLSKSFHFANIGKNWIWCRWKRNFSNVRRKPDFSSLESPHFLFLLIYLIIYIVQFKKIVANLKFQWTTKQKYFQCQNSFQKWKLNLINIWRNNISADDFIDHVTTSITNNYPAININCFNNGSEDDKDC